MKFATGPTMALERAGEQQRHDDEHAVRLEAREGDRRLARQEAEEHAAAVERQDREAG